MSFYHEFVKFDWSSRRSAEGMRLRFRPKARLNHALLSLIPWINVLILAFAVVVTLGSHLVIPGMPITLAKVPFQDGFKTDLVLLVVAEATSRNNHEQKVQVFFQDECYKLSDAQQRERFCAVIATALESRQDKDALLYVDASVEQAGLARVMDVLRETEMGRVNVVGRP